MKKVAYLVMALAFLVGIKVFSENKILIVPREGSNPEKDFMITKELGVMIKMLKDAGYNVTVASASGQPFVGKTVTLKTDLMLSEVKINNYDGLIMPCMAVGTSGPIPSEAASLVKQAYSQGIPIAAQYGSVFILSARAF